MVDCTGLENRSAFTGTKGSNPFPSAMTKITLTNSVAKFGGTSVRMYYNKIYEFCNEEKPRFVVVSAPGKGLQDKEKLTDMLFSDTASLNSNLILSYYKDIADEKNGIAHFKGTKKYKTPKELLVYLDNLGVYVCL